MDMDEFEERFKNQMRFLIEVDKVRAYSAGQGYFDKRYENVLNMHGT